MTVYRLEGSLRLGGIFCAKFTGVLVKMSENQYPKYVKYARNDQIDSIFRLRYEEYYTLRNSSAFDRQSHLRMISINKFQSRIVDQKKWNTDVIYVYLVEYLLCLCPWACVCVWWRVYLSSWHINDKTTDSKQMINRRIAFSATDTNRMVLRIWGIRKSKHLLFFFVCLFCLRFSAKLKSKTIGPSNFGASDYRLY